MHPGNRIGVQFALEVASYHHVHGTWPRDNDLGFRCPACNQPLRARVSSARTPAHFEHLNEISTCRWAQGMDLRAAARSELLTRFLTPQVFVALTTSLTSRISDEDDEAGSDGDARVPSPLRPAPFGRSSFASVAEPDDDDAVPAVARDTTSAKGFYTRSS